MPFNGMPDDSDRPVESSGARSEYPKRSRPAQGGAQQFNHGTGSLLMALLQAIRGAGAKRVSAGPGPARTAPNHGRTSQVDHLHGPGVDEQ
jgi:hypothetical protein